MNPSTNQARQRPPALTEILQEEINILNYPYVKMSLLHREKYLKQNQKTFDKKGRKSLPRGSPVRALLDPEL